MAVVYGSNTYYYMLNQQGDVIGLVNSSGTQVVAYTYDAWGRPLTTTGSMASTLGQYNPLRYRGYIYDQETNLYYLQSRYYNPTWGRFINADVYISTGQGLLGNNMFAYCGNNSVNYKDPFGTYIVAEDPLKCPVWIHIGGNASGASTAGASGGSTGLPLPMVSLNIFKTIDVVSAALDVVDVVNGLGNLSRAAEYGIKGYSSLKKDLAGTSLEAHHILEVRFLNGQGLDAKNALSVAVTKQEHQKFTNFWRQLYPYGKTDYKKLDPMDIWESAKIVYENYPDLLDAVRKTLF